MLHRCPVPHFDRVETRGLTKVYGPTRALSGVDATFTAGTVTSVEGPNGSGKSTLLSLLALIATPTRGTIRFGERDATKQPGLRRHIGVLAHAAMVYPDLNAYENLALFASLHDLPVDRTLDRERERFGLGAWANRPARTYSRGQLQRVALARALLHEPILLLLDEPSTGLDASSNERLIEAVKRERERGAIVVLVTHDQALSERIADRRLKLSQGRVDSDSEARA
jgi:ABC-type multidrug transport system ATPase subunit